MTLLSIDIHTKRRLYQNFNRSIQIHLITITKVTCHLTLCLQVSIFHQVYSSFNRLKAKRSREISLIHVLLFNIQWKKLIKDQGQLHSKGNLTLLVKLNKGRYQMVAIMIVLASSSYLHTIRSVSKIIITKFCHLKHILLCYHRMITRGNTKICSLTS